MPGLLRMGTHGRPGGSRSRLIACPLLRLEVATKAKPPKGGDAKPRGYSCGNAARQASRATERTQEELNVVVDPQ